MTAESVLIMILVIVATTAFAGTVAWVVSRRP